MQIRKAKLNSRKKWQEELFVTYERVRNEKKPYEVKVGNIEITVLPNVFSPKYFANSIFFAEALQRIVKKKSLLEIGTGTGIIALLCARKGAHVVATDINPHAIKNAKANFKRYKLKGSIRLGNVYEPIKKSEKFDFIFWSHPFNNWPKPVKDPLFQAGLDYKYKNLNDYISKARNFLAPQGRLLIGTGNFADLSEMKKIAEKNNFRMKLIDTTKLPVEKGAKSKMKNIFYIYEFITCQHL